LLATVDLREVLGEPPGEEDAQHDAGRSEGGGERERVGIHAPRRFARLVL
jgi:hypothetical protein